MMIKIDIILNSLDIFILSFEKVDVSLLFKLLFYSID